MNYETWKNESFSRFLCYKRLYVFEVNIICGVYPDGLFRLNTTRTADKMGSCCVSDAFVMSFMLLWAYEKEKCERVDAYSMRFASHRAYEKSEM